MTTQNLIHCPDWATALLNGFSQVLVQRNPLCGLFCVLAFLLTAPHLLGGALLGALAGLLTAQRRGYARSDRQNGLYSYNGVLLGVLICELLPWSAIVPPLIIAASGLSSILVHQWLKRPDHAAVLPAYTTPYIVLAGALLMVLEPATSAGIVDHDPLSALVRGLGQIFRLDHPVAGLLIVIGLLIANPYAAAWALLGSAIGGSVALLNGETDAAFYGLYSFNAALAALAFSQTRQQPWKPLLAILLAVVLQPVLGLLPMFTLTAPFVLACWVLQMGCHFMRGEKQVQLRWSKR